MDGRHGGLEVSRLHAGRVQVAADIDKAKECYKWQAPRKRTMTGPAGRIEYHLRIATLPVGIRFWKVEDKIRKPCNDDFGIDN